MGVNRQLLSKHWGSLWMGGNHTDQIYCRGVEMEQNWKKKNEGKHKLKSLVNIIMCASCNHPFKCRYRRGAMTDGQRRDTEEETRLMGTGLKLQLRPHRSRSFRSFRSQRRRRRRHRSFLSLFFFFLLFSVCRSESDKHQRSGNVTDWSSRWTVKIKRMTNERAAYTAHGANPPPSNPHPHPPTPTPGAPFWGAATEEHPQTVTDPDARPVDEQQVGSWTSWQDFSPSAPPHCRGSTGATQPPICPQGGQPQEAWQLQHVCFLYRGFFFCNTTKKGTF